MTVVSVLDCHSDTIALKACLPAESMQTPAAPVKDARRVKMKRISVMMGIGYLEELVPRTALRIYGATRDGYLLR